MGSSHTQATMEAGTTCLLHTHCHHIRTMLHHRTFHHTCIIHHLTLDSSCSSTCGKHRLTEKVGVQARTATMLETGSPRHTVLWCPLHTPVLPLALDRRCTTEVLLHRRLVTLLCPCTSLLLLNLCSTLLQACTIPKRLLTSSIRGVLHPCIRGMVPHRHTSPQHRTFQMGRSRLHLTVDTGCHPLECHLSTL